MLGNFSYSNPTRLYFGENALEFLAEELSQYGEKIFLFSLITFFIKYCNS